MSATLLVACAAACTPKAELTVTPRRACVGHPVTIETHTKGKETLTATPLGIGRGADTTRFQLTATHHGDSALSVVDIVSYPGGGTDVMVYLQHAVATGNTVSWTDTLRADEWGNQLRIQTVANRSGVALAVAHGGRTASIDTAGPGSPAFNGLEMGGPWTAVASVTPAAAPTHLGLQIRVACVPSGGTP